ncbi:MAG: P-loop NTPase fold protein [Campylobacterota bacterium]|nr:P-loop NTPase fold protein [Campylobacterota bacterium]
MSNKQQIEDALKSLILNDGKEFVAMLSGEWGIGKTYFWNKFKDNFLQPKHDFMRGENKEVKKVVYISLFGKNTLEEIQTDIISQISQWTKSIGLIKKGLNSFTGIFKSDDFNIPLPISSILSLLAKKDFKNIVICFDDFERLSDTISLKDVLGLISLFKEQKECKVIMILNEKELDKLSDIDGKKHDEIFALYKEKIVDYSFHYMPSQDELFEAIKEDIKKISFCEHDVIDDFFKKIELKNIRIMKQALYQLEHFSFIGEYRLDNKIINEFVEIALNLFVLKAKCNLTYKEFEKMHSYHYEKGITSFANAKTSSDKKMNVPTINEKYEECINYYYVRKTLLYNDEFASRNKGIIEKNIYIFIDTFTHNKKDLKTLLEDNNDSFLYYDIRNEISALNKRFYTDFSTKNSTIAKQLFSLINKHKDDMHRLFLYSDYKPFIDNIHQFSPETSTETLEREVAEKYIAFYIDNPDYDINGPLDLENGQSILLTSDYTWAHTYVDKYKKESHKTTPLELLQLIENTLKYRHLSEDDAFKFNQLSPKDYEKQIKENPNLIQPLVKFLKIPDSINVRKNIINALKSLQEENNDYAWKVEQILKSGNIKLEENE